MAVAALEVLELTEHVAEMLDPAEFVPAVGQGCVAVECRADDQRLLDALVAIDHPPTRRDVCVERASWPSSVPAVRSRSAPMSRAAGCTPSWRVSRRASPSLTRTTCPAISMPTSGWRGGSPGLRTSTSAGGEPAVGHRPLSGRRIVTTRDQRGRLDTLLASAGADVVHVPLIAITDPPDGGAGLSGALSDLGDVRLAGRHVAARSPSGGRRGGPSSRCSARCRRNPHRPPTGRVGGPAADGRSCPADGGSVGRGDAGGRRRRATGADRASRSG